MKLEYFGDAFEKRGLLLLHSGGPHEVVQLREAVTKLFTSGARVLLHELDFVESVASCQVGASADSGSRGVRLLEAPHRFLWALPPPDWERVHDLLEPFCHASDPGEGTRFQYLHEHGGTEVIYSTARQW